MGSGASTEGAVRQYQRPSVTGRSNIRVDFPPYYGVQVIYGGAGRRQPSINHFYCQAYGDFIFGNYCHSRDLANPLLFRLLPETPPPGSFTGGQFPIIFHWELGAYVYYF